MTFDTKIKSIQLLNHISLIPAFILGSWYHFVFSFFIWQILCIVSVSGGLHRYFTHKSYETNKFWEKLMLYSFVPTTLGSPINWIGTHRIHHANADKVGDPHSPGIIGFLKSQFHIWPKFNIGLHYVKDLLKNKTIIFIHKNYFKLLLTYIIILYFIDIKLGLFLYSIPALFAFHGTGLVNSVCHSFGYKNHNTQENSKNNFLVSIFSPGEGWHNNHHYYTKNPNFSEKWWEIDLTYYFIKLIKKKDNYANS